MDGEHVAGRVPHPEHPRRRLRGHRAGRAVPRQRVRPLRHDRQCLGMDRRLVQQPARAPRACLLRCDQPPRRRPGRQLRPPGTERADPAEGDQGWLPPVRTELLPAVPARRAHGPGDRHVDVAPRPALHQATGVIMTTDGLPSWREAPAKQRIMEFVDAVTDPDSRHFVPERDRIAVFDNDGTLWTEQPVYAQLVFALDRAAELGHPTSLEELHAGGMEALTKLVALTHAGITTEEFDALCRNWLASPRHPRFGRPYPATVYQPMVELLGLLDRNGFTCWIFSGGGTDFMRSWTADGYGLPPHRVIGSVGETEFRVGDGGPELVKTAKVAIVNDGPQKPSSIHRHVGQRPAVAAGNTDGDLAMLQWTAASPYRPLELIVHHTDGDREYAYDRDPILGSGTGQILAAAAEHKWTVIDMAADWAAIHPDA